MSGTPTHSESSSECGGSEEESESDGGTEKRSLDLQTALELSPKSSPPGVAAVSTSVGLSAIARYADSSGSDTDAEGVDEWEDSGNERKGGRGDGCASSGDGATSRRGKLEIPTVIQGRLNVLVDGLFQFVVTVACIRYRYRFVLSMHNVQSTAMFESPSGSGDVGGRSDDDDEEQEPGLGFFQTLSDDSDIEVQLTDFALKFGAAGVVGFSTVNVLQQTSPFQS